MFKVSKGNSKMGEITNINVSTSICKELGLPCYGKGCYACKGNYLFKNVQKRLEENTNTFFENPYETKESIISQLPRNAKVRWHASGEIPNLDYLWMILDIADECKDCQFLVYTKRYDLVNLVVSYNHPIPSNLTIVFSEWENLPMDNRYNFPVAQVDCFANKWEGNRKYTCKGKCESCGICWKLKKGDVIIFHKH